MHTPTHVTNIFNSLHVATGIILQDASDYSSSKTPVITNYLHAKTGKILYTNMHGIGQPNKWLDSQGNELDWVDFPEIEPIGKIYREWGGAECAQIL